MAFLELYLPLQNFLGGILKNGFCNTLDTKFTKILQKNCGSSLKNVEVIGVGMLKIYVLR